MRSVTLKSAITPSFMGLMATMLPGVRPSISLASLPTASTSPVFLLIATIEGSLTTMPLPRAYTKVFAVPKSIARSLEKTLNNERTPCVREEREWKPFDDMNAGLSLSTRIHCTAMVALLHRYSFESLPPLLGHTTCFDAALEGTDATATVRLSYPRNFNEGNKHDDEDLQEFNRRQVGECGGRQDFSQPQSRQCRRCGGRVSGLRRSGRRPRGQGGSG